MGLGSGLGGLAGGIAVLSGAGGKGGISEREKIVELWNKLETSNFDFRKLTFPELRMVESLMPEVYNAIVPQDVSTVTEDPRLRQAQVGAIGQMEQIARDGLPLADRIAAQGAMGSLAQESRGRDLAVLRNLAARGNLSGGDEAQLRIIGNTGANQLANRLGSGLIGSALDRRMQAIQAAGGMAGQARGQDFTAKAFNSEAINRFNSMVSGMQTDAARYAAGARGQANQYNVGTRQDLATRTQLGRVGLAEQQQSRDDLLKQAMFGQQLSKLQGLSNAYGSLANYKDRDRAAKEQAIAGIAGGIGDVADVGIGGLI